VAPRGPARAHEATHGAPDYAHWHGFFELMQELYELELMYDKRIDTGIIEDQANRTRQPLAATPAQDQRRGPFAVDSVVDRHPVEDDAGAMIAIFTGIRRPRR
jgi:hypothetical protein